MKTRKLTGLELKSFFSVPEINLKLRKELPGEEKAQQKHKDRLFDVFACAGMLLLCAQPVVFNQTLSLQVVFLVAC